MEIWEEIDPILLHVLQDGLEKGEIDPKLTIGVLILLVKRGDELLIGNKRNLTLLNNGLKILTKLYQLCLSKLLQEFIYKQQQGFLSGRNIHKSIMLLNEILHKAKELGEDFILLKLDMVKAFVFMCWEFLICLLHIIGVEPNLINMVKATNAKTTSKVLIEGKLSEPFKLRRSPRQGCPLSSPLFDCS